jgi:membrane-bound ClpP family serine protease
MGYSPGTGISRRSSLIGPVFLIAIGVVFLIGEVVPEWGISRTWPVLLIVIGVLLLLDSAMPPRPPRGPML